jgi:glycosyltransferase involved in cell wall biosynthesis
MHIDIAVCVTVTRPNLARRALESARSWPTLTFHDSQRRGAAFARNCLIQDALQRGAERVRFLDDDDEITDTRDHLLEACARHRDVDVIYTDIEKLTPFGSVVTRYTGDPLEDLRKGVYPVLWMTRTSGLMKMRRHHGRVFRDTPCMLGSYWWLDAMTAGLTFRHVPVIGYRYHTNSVGEQITKRPDFSDWKTKFKNEARDKLFRNNNPHTL